METRPADALPPDQPPESVDSDDSLERARRGEVEAFRELLRAHQARVFSFALRLTCRSTTCRPPPNPIHRRVGRIRWLAHGCDNCCWNSRRLRGQWCCCASRKTSTWRKSPTYSRFHYLP